MDAKGRIAIPTRYRAEIQERCECQMIVTVALNEKCIGEKGCLWLYPLPVWEEVEHNIIELGTNNKMAIKLRRFLVGNASECEMDGQGRLLLPEKLRKFAEMEKHIMLTGQLNKFEIWDEQAYENKEKEWMDGDDNEGFEILSKVSY